MATQNSTCNISGCERTGKLTRGMCGMHYQRFRKDGSPGEANSRRADNAGLCDIQGCERPKHRKSLCELHYDRLRKTGTTDAPIHLTPEQRFWAKVHKGTNCWEWTGSVDSSGYGTFRVGHSTVSAHRFAWEITSGPIPEGMEIDHECHNPRCVNTKHLRLATRKQNVEYRRGAFRNSKSQIRGVYREARYGKWRAEVQHAGKSIFIGHFDEIEDAESAVKQKRAELFTFPEFK